MYQAVLDVLNKTKSIEDICREYSITTEIYQHWRNSFLYGAKKELEKSRRIAVFTLGVLFEAGFLLAIIYLVNFIFSSSRSKSMYLIAFLGFLLGGLISFIFWCKMKKKLSFTPKQIFISLLLYFLGVLVIFGLAAFAFMILMAIAFSGLAGASLGST